MKQGINEPAPLYHLFLQLHQQPKTKEFDLTDPLRPSLPYNHLHDVHLKEYFSSSDIRKRLKDEGNLL